MREQHLKDYPIWDKGTERAVVRCEVPYSKGEVGRRGYWLHIQPMVLEKRDGYSVERFFPMEGRRLLVLEAKRFSEKGMRDAVSLGEQRLLDPVVAGFIAECVRVPVEV